MIKETTLTQTYSSVGQTIRGAIKQIKKRELAFSLDAKIAANSS
ncbi:hypothetical protein HMPREF9389_1244 [Streptococcus sanguinis SK355]|uniref:Uncharacterized protein n=1 Tax=Streptococcus sanguinis SK355 TaxID=888816 RepID=F3UQV6_STRSA|nr:hypothetical protein HMPREF9389_1244 [Streptococcus sanguinis SK355]